MFKQFLLSLCTFLTFAFNLSAAPSIPAPMDAFVTLRAGTTVSLTLNEALDPKMLYVGNSVDFMVRSNVTVNGKVVIAAGSIAEGWVKKVTSGCDGKCSQITVTVENVQTVDGQRINLRSIPRTFKAPCCDNCEATMNIGANLSARVLNDARINA